MPKEKEDTRCGYFLRVLKFLCKRQNTLITKQKSQNLEYLSVKTTYKTWGSLLNEINAYRGKSMKAASLERSLRELKRRVYLESVQDMPSRYIVSSKGFKIVGIKERKAEIKEQIPLPSRDKGHINIRCRNCNVIDGYSSEENKCRYCGVKLYSIDKI